MLAHNVLELGPGFLVEPQTLIPLVIFAVLAILAARATAGRGTWLALLAWILLNLVAGWITHATGVEVSHAVLSNLEFIIFGGLIIFFLIVEPSGFARLWQITKEKLRLWPFPH